MIDSTMEYTEDVFTETGKTIVASWFKQKSWDDASMDDYAKRYDKLGEFAERRLKSHGKKFIAGTDHVTVAHCKLGHVYYAVVYNDDCPLTA